MKRIIVFTFLVYYSLGTLLFPMGDLSYMKDMPDMYHNCIEEDPDMSFAEFIFEHLPNIKNTENDDEGEHEKPHQPTYHHVPAPIAAVPAGVIKFVTTPEASIPEPIEYPLMGDQGALTRHPLKVFRPPIA